MTRFKVQVAVTRPDWVGVPWKTVRVYKNKATAEHVAKYIERDGETARVIEIHRVNIGLYGAPVIADFPYQIGAPLLSGNDLAAIDLAKEREA